MPIPSWIGRERDLKIVVDFAAEYEFAPIGADSTGTYGVGIHVHYTKLTRLTVRADSQYFTNASFPSTNFGPLVTIEPAFRFVPGSRTTGPSPYLPDSRELYAEIPPGSGTWVLQDEPLEDVEYGWKITLDLGYQFTGATRTQVSYIWVGTVTFWGLLATSAGSNGPMGALLHGSGIPGDRTSWRVSITSGFPGIVTNDTPNDWCRTQGTTYATSLTGTVTMTLPLQERFTNEDTKTLLGSGPGVRLTSELGDNLASSAEYPPFQRDYTEVLRPGATHSLQVVANAGAGDETFTLSETVSTSQTRLIDDYLTPIVEPYARAFALGDSGSAVTATLTYSASLDLDGESVGPVTISKTNKAGTASQSSCVAQSPTILGRTTAHNPSGGSIEGALQTYRGKLKLGATSARLMLRPPEQIVATGHLRRLPDQANDVPLDVVLHNHLGAALATLTGVTGSFSHTFSYEGRNGSATALYFDLPAPSSGDTTAQFSGTWAASKSGFPTTLGASITAASASAAGIARPRLCLRGRRWKLWDVVHPTSLDLVAGGSWPTYSVAGLTATTNTGPPATLSLVASSGSGTHQVTFTLPRASAETRYHRIRLRSVGSANQPVRVRRMSGTTVPSQHSHDWTIQTGEEGEWVEVLLDPLASYGGDAHTLAPANATLVPGQWRLDLPASVTIELQWIRALSQTLATLDLVRVSYEDTPAPLVGVVDGSPYGLQLASSDELGDWFGSWDVAAGTVPSGAKPWGHVPPWNGYVDASGPFNQSDWYDADNVAYAAGFGLMRGAEGTPEVFLNKAYRGSVADFDAQELLESVNLFTGCGDVFGHAGGGFGTSTTLWFGILLGGAVTALEVGEEPEGGDWPDVVAYKESDGSERARAGVSGDEHYGILTPDLRAGVGYTLQLDPNEYGALSATGVDRTILRTLWLVQGSQGIDNHNPEVGQYWQALPDGDQIRVRRWDLPVPQAATPDYTTLATTPGSGERDTQPNLFTSGQGRIGLLFRRSGASAGIYETWSEDDGQTWSTPAVAIADAQQPQSAVDISGGILRAGWLRDAGNIGLLKATWQAPGDSSASSVFSLTNAAGGADLRVKSSGYSISAAPAGGSEFLLTCTLEGETSTSDWRSVDDGRSWTRIT